MIALDHEGQWEAVSFHSLADQGFRRNGANDKNVKAPLWALRLRGLMVALFLGEYKPPHTPANLLANGLDDRPNNR